MPKYKLRLWDGQREYFGDNNTGLGSSGNVIGYREGGDDPLSPRKSPGPTKFDPITMKRGLTQDSAFANWAAKVTGGSSGNVIGYREGGDDPLSPRKLPGRMKFEPITMKRGLTQDSAFANWAAKVTGFAASLGSEVSLANFRKDIYLEFSNEAGQPVVKYRISNGWVSEYPAIPPGGIRLHNLHLRNGKSVEEKLSTIFEESLSRRS